MSQTVTEETATEYILASNDNLELAFLVEQAMEEIRVRLVETLLQEIQSILQNQGKDKGKNEWKIEICPLETRMKNYAWLAVSKSEWDRFQSGCPFGVVLSTDRPRWNDVSIGVYFGKNRLTESQIAQMPTLMADAVRDRWTVNPGQDLGHDCQVWDYLEEIYRRWNEPDFLKRIRRERGDFKIAHELAERMWILATKVDSFLGAP